MSKPLLPFDITTRSIAGATGSVQNMDCRREFYKERNEEEHIQCFLAGDRRANIQLGLTIIHTIFTRLHNKIADEFMKLVIDKFGEENAGDHGNLIYHETKRVVTGLHQLITYETWLPLILGKTDEFKLSEYEKYEENLDAGIFNEFSTAAFRFGHTLIPSTFPQKGKDYVNMKPIPTHKTLFAPYKIVYGGIDPMLRGIITEPSKYGDDGRLNSELTERFFKINEDVSIDLATLNIQRGRDHGIDGYGKYRVVF